MATRKPSPAPELKAPDAPADAPPAPEASAPETSAPPPAAPESPAPKFDAVADALTQHREVVMQIRNHPLGIDARQIAFSLNMPIQQVHQAVNALEAVGMIRKANLVGSQMVSLTPIGALETGKL